MTQAEIMTHQTSLIKKPLAILPESLNNIAVQIFKNLISYMGIEVVQTKKNFILCNI